MSLARQRPWIFFFFSRHGLAIYVLVPIPSADVCFVLIFIWDTGFDGFEPASTSLTTLLLTLLTTTNFISNSGCYDGGN
jgi:hypothetical protein